MCLAGRLGLRLDLQAKDALLALFGETNGCLLVEVRPSDTDAFENQMAGLPVIRLGQVTAEPFLTIYHQKAELLSVPIASLINAWQGAQSTTPMPH